MPYTYEGHMEDCPGFCRNGDTPKPHCQRKANPSPGEAPVEGGLFSCPENATSARQH